MKVVKQEEDNWKYLRKHCRKKNHGSLAMFCGQKQQNTKTDYKYRPTEMKHEVL